MIQFKENDNIVKFIDRNIKEYIKLVVQSASPGYVSTDVKEEEVAISALEDLVFNNYTDRTYSIIINHTSLPYLKNHILLDSSGICIILSMRQTTVRTMETRCSFKYIDTLFNSEDLLILNSISKSKELFIKHNNPYAILYPINEEYISNIVNLMHVVLGTPDAISNSDVMTLKAISNKIVNMCYVNSDALPKPLILH